MESGIPDDRSEINARLTAIEQKLQQVPTRDGLFANFATRDELYANFAARDELILTTREENRRMHEETRRHFDVVAESLRDDIRVLADGQSAIIARLDASLADRNADRATLGQHDLRLKRLEKHAGFEPPPARTRRR